MPQFKIVWHAEILCEGYKLVEAESLAAANVMDVDINLEVVDALDQNVIDFGSHAEEISYAKAEQKREVGLE